MRRIPPFYRLALATLPLLAVSLEASALAMVDFTSASGQFSIANNTLNFGSGIQISAARDNANTADPSILQFVVLLDSIQLTGAVNPMAGGVFGVGIDTSLEYRMRIFSLPPAGGDLLFDAAFDPGGFIVVGAGGTISPAIGADLFDIMLTAAGTASPALAAIAGAGSVDFNLALSAAGQDIAARIQAGQLVLGSSAGSIAVLSEPGTAVLMGLGLTGLALAGNRAGRRR